MKTNVSITSRSALMPPSNRPALRAALIGGIALATAGVQAQTYSLVPISPPAGTFRSGVTAINNHGVVVGHTSVWSGNTEVSGPIYMWSAGTAVALPRTWTSETPTDISDTGLIVGRGGSVDSPRAVYWQPVEGGGYVAGDWNALLPAGSPLVLRSAYGVSHDGQFIVFGANNTVTGVMGAVVGRVEAQGMTVWTIPTIGDPPVNLLQSGATGIHFDGTTLRLAGSCKPESSSLSHAFRWELDVATGTTVMIGLDSRSTTARSVNGYGSAAGYAHNSLACVWYIDGTMQQLPTLGGATNQALCINDAGFVVGRSTRSGRNSLEHAFRWHPTTGMRDLNSLMSSSDTSGIELMAAFKINNTGQILAQGVKKNRYVNVLLTPVP